MALKAMNSEKIMGVKHCEWAYSAFTGQIISDGT